MSHVSASVTIGRPREEVFDFWRRLENLPRFMHHLEVATATGGGRSHWVSKGPGAVEWDAEVVEETSARVCWRSLTGSDVRQEVLVQFRDAPADRGTEVEVGLQYDAPGGKPGAMLVRLFGKDPTQQIRNDLRRFKQVIETGAVVVSDGNPEGAGLPLTEERPAQPAGPEARS